MTDMIDLLVHQIHKLHNGKEVTDLYKSQRLRDGEWRRKLYSVCKGNINEEFWTKITADHKLQRKYEDSHPAYEIQHPTLPASCLLFGPETDVFHTSVKLQKFHAFMETEAQRRKQLKQQLNQTARMYRNRCEELESEVQQCKLLLAKQKV